MEDTSLQNPWKPNPTYDAIQVVQSVAARLVPPGTAGHQSLVRWFMSLLHLHTEDCKPVKNEEDGKGECNGAVTSPEEMEAKGAHQTTKSVLIQVLVGLVANLAAIGPGMNLGYSAVALPPMQAANHTPHVTDSEASWVASLGSVATPIGCLISGPLLDHWGRKVSLFAVNLPGLIGWLLLATAQANSWFFTQVYAGRLLTGISTGMASVPATVYISETSHHSIRGMLVTWTSIFMALGILLVYLFGFCFPDDWKLVAGICAAFPILSALLACFLPESPVWLANRGRFDEAEHNLRKLRGRHATDHEINALVTPSPGSASLRMLFLPQVWKPLLIMNAFFFFQQFGGIFVVVFYAIDIAKEAGVVTNGYLVTVLIGLTRLLVSISISYASKRYGRRPLAMISGLGMTVFMASLAGYQFFLQKGLISGYPWFAAGCLILFILTSTIGFLTLPWAMIGEVFPSRVRGLASGITTCSAYLFSFAIVKVYPDMKKLMHSHGVFCFYAVISWIGTVFVMYFLPETHAKTLEEVENGFINGGFLRQRTRTRADIPMEEKP